MKGVHGCNAGRNLDDSVYLGIFVVINAAQVGIFRFAAGFIHITVFVLYQISRRSTTKFKSEYIFRWLSESYLSL